MDNYKSIYSGEEIDERLSRVDDIEDGVDGNSAEIEKTKQMFTSVQEDYDYLQTVGNWVFNSTFNSDSGATQTKNGYCRTQTRLWARYPVRYSLDALATDYEINVTLYDAESPYAYLGTVKADYDDGDVVVPVVSKIISGTESFGIYGICIRRKDGTAMDGNYSDTDSDAYKILNGLKRYVMTDSSLTKGSIPADAATVGSEIAKVTDANATVVKKYSGITGDTNYGVTYSMSNGVFDINGTATSHTSTFKFDGDASSIPAWVAPGEYYIEFNKVNRTDGTPVYDDVFLQMYLSYNNAGTDTSVVFTSYTDGGKIVLTSDMLSSATGAYLRFYVPKDGNADCKCTVKIFSAPSNNELLRLNSNVTEKTKSLEDNMYSVETEVPWLRDASHWTVGKYVNPATGELTNSTGYITSGVVRMPRSQKFSLGTIASDYEFDAFRCRQNGTVVSRVKKGYDNSDAIIYKTVDGTSAYGYRLCIRRADRAAMSGDTTDPNSDLSKIIAELKRYYPTDKNFETEGAAADAAATGESLYPKRITKVEAGSISLTTLPPGMNISMANRLRTTYYIRISHLLIDMGTSGCKYRVVYYSENFDYLKYDATWQDKGSRIISKYDTRVNDGDELAGYVRIVFQPPAGGSFSSNTLPDGIRIMTDDDYDYTSNKNQYEYDIVWDSPKSEGILNIVKRAYQMAQIAYVTTGTLPIKYWHDANGNRITDTSVPADTQIYGILYSAARREALSVPLAVSFHTFMTAVLNPNSYLYDNGHGREGYPDDNGLTYYGAYCSALVCYAYGLPCIYAISQMEDMPDVFQYIEDQSVYGLEVGDFTIRKAGGPIRTGHVRVITGIGRNSKGRIKYIETTETTTNYEGSRTIVQTTEDFLKDNLQNATKPFKAYRYVGRNSVTYRPSPWVTVEDDDASAGRVYSSKLMPRRGDMANWRAPGEYTTQDENVEIDIYNDTGYSKVYLYRQEYDSSQQEWVWNQKNEQNIPASKLVTYAKADLETGYYMVELWGQGKTSEYAYFEYVSAEITSVTLNGSGSVTIGFRCSPNATPTCIAWTDGNDDVSGHLYRALKTVLIPESAWTENQTTHVKSGSITTTNAAGKYCFKFHAETQFGSYCSDFTDPITVT